MSWVALGTTAIKVGGDLAKAPGGGAPLGPLDSMSKTYGTTLDGSNWTINFGTGDVNAKNSSQHTATDEERANPLTGTPGAQSAGLSPGLLALVACGGLLAWKLAA